MSFFYPRSPCGERRHLLKRFQSMSFFLSTLSLRRATRSMNINPPSMVFSIHALLAESDDSLPALKLIACLFYPRSPCGERQNGFAGVLFLIDFLSTLSLRRATWVLRKVPILGIFLSTLSLRRATARRALGFVDPDFSIHALLAESD